MDTITTILIIIIALLHFYFLVLEMFMWTQPKTIKAFGLKDKAFAEETKVLAANQGLYNGFIAAGLIYSLIINEMRLSIFFIICVIVAGIYGAYSTKKIKLFYIQAGPAIAALLTIILN